MLQKSEFLGANIIFQPFLRRFSQNMSRLTSQYLASGARFRGRLCKKLVECKENWGAVIELPFRECNCFGKDFYCNCLKTSVYLRLLNLDLFTETLEKIKFVTWCQVRSHKDTFGRDIDVFRPVVYLYPTDAEIFQASSLIASFKEKGGMGVHLLAERLEDLIAESMVEGSF